MAEFDNFVVHRRKADGTPTGSPLYSGSQDGCATFIRGHTPSEVSSLVQVSAEDSARIQEVEAAAQPSNADADMAEQRAHEHDADKQPGEQTAAP